MFNIKSFGPSKQTNHFYELSYYLLRVKMLFLFRIFVYLCEIIN